jgi:DNA-binding XRE family transcriptional regulator
MTPLAADSGVHSQTIRAISKGIVVPKIETMIKLSNFFDAQLDEIRLYSIRFLF